MEPHEEVNCDDRSHPSPRAQPTSFKPVIIGLYGLPGSGKSFRLEGLKTVLDNDKFAFYDGSNVIAAVTPGGLEAFQILTKEGKNDARERAIARVKQECSNTGKSAIVAGHFMFWAEEDEQGQSVCTPSDLTTYTHILYLNSPAELIAEYRSNDVKRCRQTVSTSHLARWQEIEQSHLCQLCRCHDILFTLVSPLVSANKLGSIVEDFRMHTEDYNMYLANQRMEDILASSSTAETVIMMDADKTLASEDSGVLFWEQVRSASAKRNPLKALFSSPLGYSYTAFRQATLLYEEALDDVEFEACCQTVSSMIHMHIDIIDLFYLIRDASHVRVVVVTCGIRSAWEKVLKGRGLTVMGDIRSDRTSGWYDEWPTHLTECWR
ncbi:hypothetical protein DTO013E5_5628 [Penicillium roqueforti]|uniref:Genomic scaffold, ProqFM164S02 n=1 Tax=Penicillium roqueforti (strain FM164) TaxID=1365484 RepID=W6Q951_PENRF|nr:hypothetical protein CBS147372_8226 [Penicillium roqueforti]CDM33198.1 unnamed protein product [Penicillium roqueforti FM164]KAI2740034.1 hypothetical protein DTO012A1_5507 [Penicillium roqueforti]KAI2748966.1 hypothetical protein DTO013F2_5985 [Penicillium roqueforti]KAI3076237.1 hypothetical protein CBS147339_5071 [Penicillium roqueforti]